MSIEEAQAQARRVKSAMPTARVTIWPCEDSEDWYVIAVPARSKKMINFRSAQDVTAKVGQ